jgi:transcriptional regulator with XRE-family HTH domain
MHPWQIFASVLREAREQDGISARALAAELGLPAHAIVDWEQGKRCPRLSSAIRWAGRLGYTVGLELSRAGHFVEPR